jgi:hypothetical protein
VGSHFIPLSLVSGEAELRVQKGDRFRFLESHRLEREGAKLERDLNLVAEAVVE